VVPLIFSSAVFAFAMVITPFEFVWRTVSGDQRPCCTAT